jgi:hypothetical protein
MNKNIMNTGYEIRIKEYINICWYESFDGWAITDLENGEVLMWKAKVDHSELHGILNKISDLNLTLVSVKRISKEL